MHCPTCNFSALTPTKLEAGLPALSCKKCGGVLISILSYRDWVERQPQTVTASKEIIRVKDSKQALQCSKCQKIMLKFRIDAEQSNHIDICTHCADVWLDDGEWLLLKLLGLRTQMTHVFNDPWQINLRKEKIRDNYLVQLKALVGEQDFDNMTEFKSWLDAHPKRPEILHFLRRDMK